MIREILKALWDMNTSNPIKNLNVTFLPERVATKGLEEILWLGDLSIGTEMM